MPVRKEPRPRAGEPRGSSTNGHDSATGVTAPSRKIFIPKLEFAVFQVEVVGDSPLICHRWSEKAKQQMRDTQEKKPKAAKEPKDPERCFRDSLYILPDATYGFPAVAFKNAAVDACSFVDGVTKVEARGAFHVFGTGATVDDDGTFRGGVEWALDMVRLEGRPQMREDMVRIGNGVADLRYRGMFFPWRTTFFVKYDTRVFTIEQILNLFNHAGFSIGVGEWRPQRDGSFGMFHVAAE